MSNQFNDDMDMEMGPRVMMVRELEANQDSSLDDESEEDEDDRWRELARGQDVPSDYWHIQKLIKYMKVGNQTATTVALACLKDQDLSSDTNQMAIRECGGMEVLVNLLEAQELKCKLGALAVLKVISLNIDCRRAITDLGGVQQLVEILDDPARDLQILAAETIANVCKIRKARKIVRKSGGIPKLVDLLDADAHILETPRSSMPPEEVELVDVVVAGARALWALSTSQKNKEAMRKTGVVRLLARLLRSGHNDIIVPIMGTVQQCATEANFQLAIQTEGMIPDLVEYLSTENTEIQKHCASAIFKCAEDPVTRDIVREHGGLEPLVELVKDERLLEDKPLIAAVTGAIWKCAISLENVKKLNLLGIIPVMTRLLQDQDKEVVTNVVGALAECCKVAANRSEVRAHNAIKPLVLHLNGTHQPLLRNVARALNECAKDKECMLEIEELDGVRLIWSLLKNDSPDVQAEAAWALCPCIMNATDSGEMVRSFVGGLELIVSLLKSPHTNVLASVCAALARVALDRENLAVITDHGVVPMLAQLVLTLDAQDKERTRSRRRARPGNSSARKQEQDKFSEVTGEATHCRAEPPHQAAPGHSSSLLLCLSLFLPALRYFIPFFFLSSSVHVHILSRFDRRRAMRTISTISVRPVTPEPKQNAARGATAEPSDVTSASWTLVA
ncbi:armadillo repeat-containing protein gudu [Frankliniella occidentalis]|uniref:Armadillo repeat-containing protein gudu n=1 Tax=Frankliniella occidentalis TaxID=133901 RepID=A0A6J1TE23_FRAOC|nr:armadillo repeat-containing protein gudu [Frankliniella occidentalis]